MIGRGRFVGGSPGRRAPLGLGTVIVPSEDFKRPAVNTYCYRNPRKLGQICCTGLDPGDPFPDGRPACNDGYGPVPEEFENVTMLARPDGRAVIVGGPPSTELSDPFRVAGDTRGTFSPSAPSSPDRASGARPPPGGAAAGPGGAAPATAMNRYIGAALIAAGIIAAGIILTRPRPTARPAVAAPPPPAPTPPAPPAPPPPAPPPAPPVTVPSSA